MKKETNKIIPIIFVALLSILVASPAKAEVNGEASSTKIQNQGMKKDALLEKKNEMAEKKSEMAAQKTDRVRTAADKELDKRIEDLGKLSARIQEFKNVSDGDKASIVASINSLVANLNSLKAQIDSTTSTTTLKEARESIAKNYRIYALAMPRLNIVAASDRVITMVSMLNIVGAKLEARLGALATSSQITTANIASLQTTLVDFKTKITDAQTQAQAAVGAVANLVPDMGDKTVLESNTKVLKDARAKIKTAQADLVAAKKDAETIMKTLNKSDKEQEKLRMKSASSTTPTN